MDSGSKLSDRIGDRIGDESIKNLLNIEKLAKFKKLDFAKTKLSEIDFLIFRAKKAFIYL